MKKEHKGILPVFISVILLSMITGAFSPLSAARDVLMGMAFILFLGGILFFNIRAGWMKERQTPRGVIFSASILFGSACLITLCGMFKDFVIQWPAVNLLRNMIVVISLFAGLNRIGALIATGVSVVKPENVIITRKIRRHQGRFDGLALLFM